MKKTLLNMVCIGCIIIASAQETVITEKDGKVGIGTSTPGAKLHVQSTNNSERFNTYLSGNSLHFDRSNNGSSYIDKTDSGDLILRFGLPVSNRFTFKNSGRFGIGTTTPSEQLEIYESITSPGVISLKSYRNDAGFVDVGRISAKQGTTEVSRIGMPRAGGTFTGYLTFWTKDRNSSSLSEKMRINEFGDVGIGIPSPVARLHVANDKTGQGDSKGNMSINSVLTLKPHATNSTNMQFAQVNNGNGMGIQVTNHNNTANWDITLNPFGGKVGVGTTKPRSRLDLGGSVGAEKGLRVGDYIEINERETINNAGVIGFNAIIDKSDVSKFKPAWAGAANASGMVMTMASGGRSDLNFYGYQWGTNSFSRSLNEFTKVLHLGTDGKVGVGTNTVPNDYKFAVAGKIITTEVKVQLQSGWPDYVFEDTYELPALQEVENHIKIKGHLPNIPSAKEVEKAGGIELGSMNKKLLEKIEELILYTIQQDKQLKKQSSEINRLKSQNSKLIELAKEIELIKQKLK